MYVANHPSKLADEYAAKHTAWCGLSHLLSWDDHTCCTRISPFQETAVAVVKPGSRSGVPLQHTHVVIRSLHLPCSIAAKAYEYVTQGPK